MHSFHSDPEEFLNMLFKHILRVSAFVLIRYVAVISAPISVTMNLNYRRPFGVDKDFFVQLFVELDPSLKLPTVGELLKRMFKEQQISLTKVTFLPEPLVATVYISYPLESQ